MLEQLREGDAAKWLGVIHFQFTKRKHGARGNIGVLLGYFNGAFMHQGFRHVHNACVITKRLVRLHGGELRIMAAINAFIAKVAVDFKHARHAAGDQTL